jgi:hypothetical protein
MSVGRASGAASIGHAGDDATIRSLRDEVMAIESLAAKGEEQIAWSGIA